MHAEQEGPIWSGTFWNASWPITWIVGPLMMVLCMAIMMFMMRGHRRHHAGDSDALAILKARFARGDITRSEYDEQRRIIQA